MDAVDEAFRVNPSKPSQAVNNYIRKAAASFNLPENRVFPLINYKNEPTKSFALDVLILRVLFTAVDVARDFALPQQVRNLIFEEL